MKKILALVLALCMVFALCACGQSAAPAEEAPAAAAEAPAAEVLETVEAAKAAIIAGEKTVPTTLEECPTFTLAE